MKSTARLDPFADTIGDYNNIMSRVRVAGNNNNFDDRFTNSIYYSSPTFGGVKVEASYALRGEGFDDTPPGFDPEDDNAYSIAGTWTGGAVSVSVAYEKQNGGSAPGAADPSAWKIGGSFKVLPTTTLYAMIDRIDTDVDGMDERMGYYVAAKHSVGNIDLLANFMVARDTDADDDGAKGFALGAVYNFSKRTNIGAYYAQVKNEDNGRYGFRSDSRYAPASAMDEDKVKGFSVRLRHSF